MYWLRSQAARTRSHQDVQFTPGQWVYVWRRSQKAAAKSDLLCSRRDRLCGPGTVVFHSEGTVWVAIRNRLWKCSSIQVRHANADEALGCRLMDDPQWQDLLNQVRNGRASAVNVQAEGEPSDEAWDEPISPMEEVPTAPGADTIEQHSGSDSSSCKSQRD